MSTAAFETIVRRVSARIRKRRAELGLSQEDVAHEAGLSLRQYQYVEGGRTNPTLKTLCGIANVLEQPVEKLLHR